MYKKTISASVLALACLLNFPISAQEKKTDRKAKKIIVQSGDSKELILELDGDKIKLNGETITVLKDDTVFLKDMATSISDQVSRISGEVADWGRSLAESIQLDLTIAGIPTPPTPPSPPAAITIPPIPPVTMGWGWSENSVNKGSNASLGVYTEKADKGTKVVRLVKGSPAAALLKNGDIITHVNKTRVEGPEDLSNIIGTYNPGDEISVKYLREGKKKKADIILHEQPDKAFQFRFDNDFSKKMNKSFQKSFNNGFHEKNFTGKSPLGIQIQDREDGKGVTVLNAQKNYAGAKAGIQKDDVIVSIDDKPVNNIEEAKNAIQAVDLKGTYIIKFLRNGEEKEVEITRPAMLKSAEL